jgi:hypothetical protein
VPEELLWHETPEDHKGHFDALTDVIDWELNIDPDMYQKRFMASKLVKLLDEMKVKSY